MLNHTQILSWNQSVLGDEETMVAFDRVSNWWQTNNKSG